MVKLLFDQYTLLHFATGVIFYFWDFSLLLFFVIHTIFEIVENTKYGIYFINKYLTFWPGGKLQPDGIINNIGDTIGALCGWYAANLLDNWYK
jgi:hypothetical protein